LSLAPATLRSHLFGGWGRLNAIGSNIAGWGTIADSFLYQPATTLRYGFRYASNSYRLKQSDADGRVTRLYAGPMHDLAFGWNNVDNLSTISDWVYGSTHSATMGYDSRDRLSTVTRSGDNQIFGLDASGNRIAHNRGLR